MSMVLEVNTRGLDKKFGLINTEITKGMVSDGDQAARKTAFFMIDSASVDVPPCAGTLL